MSNSSDPHSNVGTAQSPIILLSKGGGGSRLLSVLAQDLGVFLGSSVNVSGDSMEMVGPVYRGVIRSFCSSMESERTNTGLDLRKGAQQMWQTGGCPTQWGFKLPESMFLINEISSAFPDARFVHLIRDPLATCLRRTHKTARLDNEIGCITLPAAYAHAGRPAANILSDSECLHMAYTTKHQLSLAKQSLLATPPSQVHEIRFEDLIVDPLQSLSCLSEWLGLPVQTPSITETVDATRAQVKPSFYPSDQIEAITAVLHDTRVAFGYITE
jgi:hypothetical protein